MKFLCAALALGLVTTTTAQAQDEDHVITNSIGMKLTKIPAGEFMMGDEEHQREVTIAQEFHLGLYEVTQEQYEKVMGTNPSHFDGDEQRPVEMVCWDDAVEFCRKLSELPEEKVAGHIYRLPTEAEWEYACRAGTTTQYSFGDDASKLGEFAWYKDSQSRTHPVGQKKSNPWGLYDMHGNVLEWCSDEEATARGGSGRVFRGGCWRYIAEACRSSFRGKYLPSRRSFTLGFRVALEPSGN